MAARCPLSFPETGLGNASYPQIGPGETLAHLLVDIHIYGIDELGELVTLCSATLADLFMHIPGFKPSRDSHETAVKPR